MGRGWLTEKKEERERSKDCREILREREREEREERAK